jgi:hypothetical protein
MKETHGAATMSDGRQRPADAEFLRRLERAQKTFEERNAAEYRAVVKVLLFHPGLFLEVL